MAVVLVWQCRQIDPKGARAVVCYDVFDVEQARQHNNMNVLCIGADYTDFDTAKYMIEAFFKTKFLKGRHTRRIKKLDVLM